MEIDPRAEQKEGKRRLEFNQNNMGTEMAVVG